MAAYSENDDRVKCIKCRCAISESDWSQFESRVIRTTDGFQHKKCKEPNYKGVVDAYRVLFDSKFVSSSSQYTFDSTGSCTINALEAALQLQIGTKPSVMLVNQIVQLAALYQNNKHTSVMDVYPRITRYNRNLTQVHKAQISVKDISKVVDMLINQMRATHKSVSAILTKPPESIFFHCSEKAELILFDSHPRKTLDGAHFLLFENRNNLEDYMMKLWPFNHLGKGFDHFQAQQINLCDVTLFQLTDGQKDFISQRPDLESMRKELKQIGNHLDNEWQQSQRNKRNYKNEKNYKNEYNNHGQYKHNNYNKTQNTSYLGNDERMRLLKRIQELESEVDKWKQLYQMSQTEKALFK